VQELKTVIEQIQIYSKNGQTFEKITAYIPKDVKAVLQRLADQGLGQGSRRRHTRIPTWFTSGSLGMQPAI
jgi:hypothetical protein